jgi:hypothetical protein
VLSLAMMLQQSFFKSLLQASTATHNFVKDDKNSY